MPCRMFCKDEQVQPESILLTGSRLWDDTPVGVQEQVASAVLAGLRGVC